jgi:cysteinyl-tRNA synthetase
VPSNSLELFNTLSGKLETLSPIGAPALRMYACGPTVYDYGHIGNFRTFLHVDVLRRFIQQLGIPVNHVMNITDVDDKIIRNAAAARLPMAEYTKKYEDAFFEDMRSLGIEMPEHLPRATAHIPEMVSLIERLAARDFAYQAEDGSWYFRIARDTDYGKLAKKDLESIEDGARVDLEEYDKDAARDFALWKAVKAAPGPSGNDTLEPNWETVLGSGRPGWHIECSAMATSLLGDSFDLHAGGEDLMFPHHENEIAQSECASGIIFARHWMHVRFLLVEGRKMSKSEGNFYTLRDLLLKGYRASAIRMLLISVPYRHQLNFTFDGLTQSTNAIERLRTFHQRLLKGTWPAEGTNEALCASIAASSTAYTAALSNDLNTADSLSAIFDMVRSVNSAADSNTLYRSEADAALRVLALFDAVFAVLEDHDADLTRAALAWAEREGRLDQADPSLIATLSLSDAAIEGLIADRALAKKQRNFAKADAIRNDLLAKGILLKDGATGTEWSRK